MFRSILSQFTGFLWITTINGLNKTNFTFKAEICTYPYSTVPCNYIAFSAWLPSRVRFKIKNTFGKKNVKSTWQSVNLINLFHVGSRSFCITQCLSLSLSLKSEIYFSLYTQDLKIIILCQFDFNMNRNRRNIVNDTYISDSISKYIYGNKANHLVCFYYLKNISPSFSVRICFLFLYLHFYFRIG